MHGLLTRLLFIPALSRLDWTRGVFSLLFFVYWNSMPHLYIVLGRPSALLLCCCWTKIESWTFSIDGCYPPITYYWTVSLILDHSYLVGNLTNSKIPLISRWELDKFKNCWNKSFRTTKILTLLYQQFSNLKIFQWDMSGPRLGALSNNRWSGGSI